MRVWIALFAPSLALAAPIAWSGRLLDAAGDPVNGHVELVVTLQDASATELFSETFSELPVHNGYASVLLGAGATALEDTVFDADALFVHVTADGESMGEPRPMYGAPYAHTATRLGAPGAGIRVDEGTVVIEGDLQVDGVTQLDAVQIGERYVLTIEGQACTNQEWSATIANSAAHTLIKARMSFSHCEDGCHHAYREWVGLFNSYTTMIPLEDTTSYGSNAGTWSMTRTGGSQSRSTVFRKSADPTHAYCGDVNVWIESNKPISLVSQSDG